MYWLTHYGWFMLPIYAVFMAVVMWLMVKSGE